MNLDLITKSDLKDFKIELCNLITDILSKSQPKKKEILSNEPNVKPVRAPVTVVGDVRPLSLSLTLTHSHPHTHTYTLKYHRYTDNSTT